MQGCWGLLRWGWWHLARRVHIRPVHDHARCSCGSGLARDAGGAALWSGRVLTLLPHRVHIRHFLITETMGSLLQRVPFERTQKEPKGPCPIVRPSLRSGSLAPAPLRGHAATGHPWPDRSSPGIHAGRPTPRNLLSASRRGGRSRSRSKARSRSRSKARSKARSKTGSNSRF